MSRYRYKGYWVQIFICDELDENGHLLYQPYVELPNKRGVVACHKYKSLNAAELAANRLIEFFD